MKTTSNWTWLFPFSYALHIAEEYWGGFYLWLSDLSGADLSREDFLLLNGIAFVVMTAGVAIGSMRPGARWLLAGFGTVVLVNSLLHIGGSMLTRSYSPGVVTGTVLWLPLGLYALRRVRREVSAGRFAAGIMLGIALHLLVTALAMVS
jgi:hypothetical protein